MEDIGRSSVVRVVIMALTNMFAGPHLVQASMPPTSLPFSPFFDHNMQNPATLSAEQVALFI